MEEEFWLADPSTGRAEPRAPSILRRTGRAIEGELFRHQLEIQSAPHQDLANVVHDLRVARSEAGRGAEEAGLALVASGVVVLPSRAPEVSDDDRYRDMLERYGEVALTAGTCGMHVHVGIESDEEGVMVIDRITPWLPVLVAIGANSPFADGRDTSYASWRSELWSRWPSAGPTEPFGDLAGYRSAADALITSGAARDQHMLYFDARLSQEHPTVELRVVDVATDPEDAGLVAALARGLVETASRGDLPTPRWRTEMLSAARWHAARHGLSHTLLSPTSSGGETAPAEDVVRALVTSVAEALEDAGDAARVRDGVVRVLAATGATRQRAALERTGATSGVVDDLVVRTRASWAGVA